MGHREAATRRLSDRLPEVAAQLGRVRHGKAGAIEQEDPVSVPPLGQSLFGGGDQGASDGALQALEQGPGQAGARLAVGSIGEGQAAAAAQFADGGVAVEDLVQEQVSSDDRPEVAVAPAVADFVAESVDEFFGDSVGNAALDAVQRLCHIKHGDLLVVMTAVQPHHGRGSLSVPGQRNLTAGKQLQLNLMAFSYVPISSMTFLPGKFAATAFAASFAMKKTLSLSEPLPIFWHCSHWHWPPPSAGSTETPHEEGPSGSASKARLNRARVQSM